MNFKEKADEAIQEWKLRAEELQLQLSLGRMEAIDELEKQKSNFKSFINETTNKVNTMAEKINPEIASQLKTKFEEMQVQLALGQAESKEAFEKQKEKINQGLDSIFDLLKKGIKNAGMEENLNSFLEKFEGTTETFKTKLEAAKLQFALGKADAKDDLEKNKKEVTEKLNEIRSKIDSNKEIAEEKWEGFRTEISEAFNHIKTAFSKL
jgi:hypothetical protein